jgi:hypothetical protein
MAEKWIAGAIKRPGALHKELHVPEGKPIPKRKLAKAAHEGGKVGRRARLAETLEGFHHEGKTMRREKHEREEHEERRERKHAKRKEHGHERKRAEHKGETHHKHGEHHEREGRGKHETGRGMTGKGSPRYDREMNRESEHSTPVKVPPSMPWPHDEYKGRGHHTIGERSNGMLSRHDASRKIKVTR